MEQDKPLDPIYIRLFRANGIVLHPDRFTDLIQKFFGR